VDFKPIPPDFVVALLGRYDEGNAKQILENLTKEGFYEKVEVDGKEKYNVKLPRMAATILGKKYELLFKKVPDGHRPFEFMLAFVYGTKYSVPSPTIGSAKRGYDLGREFLKNTDKVPEWLEPLDVL
jgi:hypothetical protein